MSVCVWGVGGWGVYIIVHGSDLGASEFSIPTLQRHRRVLASERRLIKRARVPTGVVHDWRRAYHVVPDDNAPQCAM